MRCTPRHPALTLALALFSLATVASAAIFTVDDLGDAVDANPGNAACQTATGACTLRAAMQEANATAGADEIVVPAGTVTLTIAGAFEDAAATGDLDITDDLTVTGAGASVTFVDAAGLDRVFDVGANVTLSGLTVRGGDAQGLDGGGMFIAPFGADITVDVSDVHVTGNTANHGGGVMKRISLCSPAVPNSASRVILSICSRIRRKAE
jgi:CSLREA domain-containing protein